MDKFLSYGFVAISIDKYIKKHLDSNPSENENELRKRLKGMCFEILPGISRQPFSVQYKNKNKWI